MIVTFFLGCLAVDVLIAIGATIWVWRKLWKAK